MRPIKFRGIRELTNEWTYGYLIKREEPYLHDIVAPLGDTSSVTHAIIRGTESQYTGLKDKNGVETYEADVLKDPKSEWMGSVVFTGDCQYALKGKSARGSETYIMFSQIYLNEWEVIGNIIDNPKLLSDSK